MTNFLEGAFSLEMAAFCQKTVTGLESDSSVNDPALTDFFAEDEEKSFSDLFLYRVDSFVEADWRLRDSGVDCLRLKGPYEVVSQRWKDCGEVVHQCSKDDAEEVSKVVVDVAAMRKS